MSPLKKYESAGFTLVEVLVASVILIMSIATVSMIFRGAFISSEKANTHVKIAGVLPSVLVKIRNEIREEGNSVKAVLGGQSETWEVEYQWQAKLLELKSAPPKFDVDRGDFISQPLKYKLWQVELKLESNGLAKQYQFKELSWNNE